VPFPSRALEEAVTAAPIIIFLYRNHQNNKLYLFQQQVERGWPPHPGRDGIVKKVSGSRGHFEIFLVVEADV
jgi:hypothetical protein